MGLSQAQLAATAHSAPDDPVSSEQDRLLLRLADEIHETACLSDALWSELIERWSAEELIELVVTAGWYRVISALINIIRPELEPWAARFPPRGEAHVATARSASSMSSGAWLIPH